MAVTWTLKAADGSSLNHQPGAGSPLALRFTSAGDVHLDGYAGELAAIVEVDASTSTVALVLTPDTSGYALDETASTPTRVPSTHTGSYAWSDSGATTTVTLGVPGSTGVTYQWDFGQGEPAVALRMIAKVKKES